MYIILDNNIRNILKNVWNIYLYIKEKRVIIAYIDIMALFKISAISGEF